MSEVTVFRGPLCHVDVLKWVASGAQIAGYGATAYGLTPWNMVFFIIGLSGWFAVGVLWRDRAIILIHAVALVAMVSGMLSS